MSRQLDLLKLLAAPSPLPESSASEGSLSRYVEKLLTQYVGGALSKSLLPPTTLLVHYLHIPPPPNETPFEVPLIVTKDEARAGEVLGSFTQFRNTGKDHRHIQISLSELAVRSELKEGLIVIISSQSAPPTEGTGLFKHVHVHLKDLDNIRVSAIPAEFLRGLELNDVAGGWHLYSDDHISQIFKAFQANRHTALSHDVKHEISTDEEKALLEELFVHNGGDYTKEYLVRVAPVVKTAVVVYCIPALYKMGSEDRELAKEMGGGACVFYMSNNPTKTTLENLYLISHKLCRVTSNIYDVARVVSEKKIRKDSIELLECVRHSLVATLKKGIAPNSTSEMVGRMLKLEEITISAASALTDALGKPAQLDWNSGGFNGESVKDTIEKAFSNYLFNLKVVDDIVRNCLVDPRLVVILIELGRNLEKRASRRQSTVEIAISNSIYNNKAVDVEMSTTCTLHEARELSNHLRVPTDFRGVYWIATMASKMFDSLKGHVSWTFSYANSDTGEEVLREEAESNYWHIEGPSSIFKESSTDPAEKLTMKFRAQCLTAILG